MFLLIPGFVISLFTFPGVIIHELSHKLFCQWTGVGVREVCYFRIGNPAGYVVHDETTNFKQTFFITAGPLIVGTALALLVFFLSRIFPKGSVLGKIIIWLGGSIAMNAFPSAGDAKNLWRETNRHIRKNLIAILGYPFALIIWVANFLRIFWFDLIYAVILYFLVTLILK